MGRHWIRNLHRGLGLVIWPLLLVIAVTGLYQNHQSAIDQWLPNDPVKAETLASLPPAPVDATATGLQDPQAVTLFGRPAWASSDGKLGVDAATGARWHTGPYLTLWHDAEGALIGWRVDWQSLFLRLHRAGWTSDRFGTWPADLTALALLVFAASGLYLALKRR